MSVSTRACTDRRARVTRLYVSVYITTRVSVPFLCWEDGLTQPRVERMGNPTVPITSPTLLDSDYRNHEGVIPIRSSPSQALAKLTQDCSSRIADVGGLQPGQESGYPVGM